MTNLLHDVRGAIRWLARNPGFTLVGVLTLAVGIGLTTAVFSVVHAVLVRSLPYADGDRLVVVWETFRNPRGGVSPGHFRDWSEQTSVFESTAAMEDATYNVEDPGRPERIRATRVTFDYFRVAYIAPIVGRYFTREDNDAGQPVVVLSHGLWQSRFGGDPSIVGRTIRLSGTPFTVIGVAPSGYALTDPARIGVFGGFSTQAWTLLVFTPEQRASYGSHYLFVLGKLKSGVTHEAAQADVERVTRGIAERNPKDMAGRWVNLQMLDSLLTGNVRRPLLLLFGAVALVLLIGCVNIASLLLARATARRREMAIRASLGGQPARIVRQLLTESAALALVGGGLSLVVAYSGLRFLIQNGPENVPRLGDAGLEPVVLLFALGLTVLTTLLFGSAPAIRAARTNIQHSLHPAGDVGSPGASRDRLRSMMVAAQIGVSAVLLVATGLLVRSALNLQKVSFGFDAENVLTARLALPAARYADSDAVTDAYRRILEQISAVPGISFASASTNVPLGGNNIDAAISAEGTTFPPGEAPSPNIRLISDDYFAAIGMAIVRGRSFRSSDIASGAARVVVINDRLAAMLWPGENPIGKHISGWTTGPEPEWREVVGVVGNARTFGREKPVQPEMFWPYTQAPFGAWDFFGRSLALVIRTTSYPETYATSVREAVWRVDQSLPLFNVRTMEDVVGTSTATPRFYMRLIGLLAVTGLALAVLGLYGVITYFVTRRSPEIGIRMALGAKKARVIRMVVGHGLATALTGIFIGLSAALALTRPMTDLLYEVEPTDAPTFAAVAGILAATALAASWLPARRAARVDPVVALRAE